MEEKMEKKELVSVERMHFLEGEGPTKAFCDLKILDIFIVKGLRVVQGKESLFLSMPQEAGKDGKWYDTFFPISRDLRKSIEELVLDYYENSQVKQL